MPLVYDKDSARLFSCIEFGRFESKNKQLKAILICYHSKSLIL
ncbi:hypothetical protein BOVA115_1234 [Bacteroides ovatus]|nr:hypothetical protein BOVA115_1234 [Bacteroides ovatus]